jgi:hypothetical protein
VGGVGGVLFAQIGPRANLVAAPPNLSVIDFSLDFRTFGFALATTIVAGIGSGLLPALQRGDLRLFEGLKQGGCNSFSTPGRQRIRNALVILEVVAVVVAYQELADLNPGFETGRLLSFHIDLDEDRFSSDTDSGRVANAAQINFQLRAIRDRLLAIRGVEGVATSLMLPINDTIWLRRVTLASQES